MDCNARSNAMQTRPNRNTLLIYGSRQITLETIRQKKQSSNTIFINTFALFVPSGYIVPSGLTYGDFIVANLMCGIKFIGDPELVKKHFPVELNLYIERVTGQKQLAEYIAARKF